MTQNDFDEATEKELMEELRQCLKGIMTPEMYADDSVFIRFLRARNHDLKASENMLRNHILWRKNNKIDTLLTWYTPSEVGEKYITMGPLGFDKDGSPVLYSHFGNLDTRGCLKALKLSELTNHFTYLFESDVKSLQSQSTKLNRKIDQWTYIFNFENFSLATATHKATLEGIGAMFNIYEANYPERLKAAYIVNASWYFQIGFAVIKPLLSGHTLSKVQIFGKSGWKDALLSQIDADELPKFLGGNRTDPDGDPKCKSIIKFGGPVPEKYFADRNKVKFSTQPGVKKLTVNRASKETLVFHVSEPGSDIEFEFETKKYDISVSLLYREKHNSGNVVEVMPKQRFDTSISSESGLVKCKKAGAYYLEFDNTYSWVHQKDIYYKVNIICPERDSS